MKLELGDDTKPPSRRARGEPQAHCLYESRGTCCRPEIGACGPGREGGRPCRRSAGGCCTRAGRCAGGDQARAQRSPLAERPKQKLDSALQQSSAGSPVPVLIAISAVARARLLRDACAAQEEQRRTANPQAIDIVAQSASVRATSWSSCAPSGVSTCSVSRADTTTPIATSDELEDSFAARPSLSSTDGVAAARAAGRTQRPRRKKRRRSAASCCALPGTASEGSGRRPRKADLTTRPGSRGRARPERREGALHGRGRPRALAP